jgi:hypothetical protein
MITQRNMRGLWPCAGVSSRLGPSPAASAARALGPYRRIRPGKQCGLGQTETAVLCTASQVGARHATVTGPARACTLIPVDIPATAATASTAGVTRVCCPNFRNPGLNASVTAQLHGFAAVLGGDSLQPAAFRHVMIARSLAPAARAHPGPGHWHAAEVVVTRTVRLCSFPAVRFEAMHLRNEAMLVKTHYNRICSDVRFRKNHK